MMTGPVGESGVHPTCTDGSVFAKLLVQQTMHGARTEFCDLAWADAAAQHLIHRAAERDDAFPGTLLDKQRGCRDTCARRGAVDE